MAKKPVNTKVVNKGVKSKAKSTGSIFSDILLQGIKAGQVPARSADARKWYRDKAKSVGRVSESVILRDDPARLKNQISPGRLYAFIYDAKHKETLPYYDTFPMVFPLRKDGDNGFLGINLHYLPLNLRAQLMDALYETVNNQKYDESTKLKISYEILNAASKYALFKPTIKKYLRSQVRSRFVEIHSTEWDIALFLGVDQFVKASRTKVWEDSKAIIRGAKNK